MLTHSIDGECAICFDEMPQSRMLPCLHTLCMRCAQKVVSLGWPCPLCKSKIMCIANDACDPSPLQSNWSRCRFNKNHGSCALTLQNQNNDVVVQFVPKTSMFAGHVSVGDILRQINHTPVVDHLQATTLLTMEAMCMRPITVFYEPAAIPFEVSGKERTGVAACFDAICVLQ